MGRANPHSKSFQAEKQRWGYDNGIRWAKGHPSKKERAPKSKGIRNFDHS